MVGGFFLRTIYIDIPFKYTLLFISALVMKYKKASENDRLLLIIDYYNKHYKFVLRLHEPYNADIQFAHVNLE